jgi:hypothetical protein
MNGVGSWNCLQTKADGASCSGNHIVCGDAIQVESIIHTGFGTIQSDGYAGTTATEGTSTSDILDNGERIDRS